MPGWLHLPSVLPSLDQSALATELYASAVAARASRETGIPVLEPQRYVEQLPFGLFLVGLGRLFYLNLGV